jgi:Phage tail tube protein, GTA-gp10
MINRKRGEVLWHYGGKDYRLCLTLGALAELEDYFSTMGLAALSERLSQGAFSAHDLIALLYAGLRGGGETINRSELAELPIEAIFPSALTAIGEMVQAAFGDDAGQGGEGEQRGPFLGRR